MRVLALRSTSVFILIVMICIFWSQSVFSKDRQKKLNKSPFELNATLMGDWDRYDNIFSDTVINNKTDSELRRARVALKYKKSDWNLKVQVDYDESKKQFEFKDIYLSYRLVDHVSITLGQQKEPFGLEKINSLRRSLFIERTIATQALAPGRNEGIAIAEEGDKWFWKLGYYRLDASKKKRHPKAVTARAGWLALKSKKLLWHFAISSSYRYLQGERYRINERIEIHSSDSVIEGKSLKADRVELSGAEMLFQRKAFSLVTEFMASRVKNTKGRSRRYNGNYWQLGYRITGESHQYKMGKFGGIKPSSSLGAWELTYRESEMKLKKEQQSVQVKTYGINYYLNDSTKVMFNFLNVENNDGGVLTKGRAYAARFQYSF